MELLAEIPLIGNVLTVVIPFLIVLSVVVFVHEYGHYIVGRWCGIGAEVFSIGFGKRLFSWVDSRGTRWQVAALPLGGYVKFVGDLDPASAGRGDDSGLTDFERQAAFHNAALWKRTLTVAAGPVFNFLLSILIFAALVLAIGKPTDQPVIAEISEDAPENIGFQEGDRVVMVDGKPTESFGDVLDHLRRSDAALVPAVVEREGRRIEIMAAHVNPPRIGSVSPGMAAARAGLVPGDLITEIDGKAVHSFYDLQMATTRIEPGEEITVEVRRGGEELQFTFTPEIVERAHPETGETVPLPTFGIRAASAGGIGPPREGVGPGEALMGGALQTWQIISGTVTFVGDMIFANADTSQLGGPIRIAEISGDKAEEGVESLIWLIATLSTSIGLINLFPIPVLDGGHLMFYAVEAVRGRPLGENWLQVGNAIGLALVLSLMVFATYNDLARYWTG